MVAEEREDGHPRVPEGERQGIEHGPRRRGGPPQDQVADNRQKVGALGHDLVDQLAEVLFIDPMEGYIGRILYALAKLGVIPSDAANDPWGPKLTAPELDNINRLLNTLRVHVN